MIPIRYFINGTTVRQEAREHVTYWHVELDRHDVVFADGLPCESYLELGNRGAFDNGDGIVTLHPGFASRIWDAKACAPLILGGPLLLLAQRRALVQATALGYEQTCDPGLRVLHEGQALVAEVAAECWRIRIPRDAQSVRLVSRTWVPAQMWPGEEDVRELGVAISRLWLDRRQVSPHSPGLACGWHDPDPGRRWTDGNAELGVAGARELAFEIVMTGIYWRDGGAHKLLVA